MNSIPEFVSLGPWCYAAGILKACGLRHCSYPFDWCQSGSLHHSEVLTLEPTEFYYRHIHNPVQHLRYIPLTEVDSIGHTHGRLEKVPTLYGYDLFYNPHRKHGQEIGYFLRCLQRLRDLCNNPSMSVIFFLSDYIDKPGNTFLNNYHGITEILLNNLISLTTASSYGIVLRTHVKECLFPSYIYTMLSPRICLITELMPISLELSQLEDPTGLILRAQSLARLTALKSALSLLDV